MRIPSRARLGEPMQATTSAKRLLDPPSSDAGPIDAAERADASARAIN